MRDTVRVVVVDDHQLMALSLTAPLESHAEIDAQAIDFRTAFGWTEEWKSVDVALVDAADPGHGDDHYPGVRLSAHVRSHGGPNMTIAVVTSRYTDHALRARLVGLGADGADYCFDRDDLRDAARLRAFVLDPASERAPVPDVDPEWWAENGITDRSELEQLIDTAQADEVLRHDSYLSRTTRSRREMDRRLSRINELGLGRPGSPSRHPTVEQVRRVLRRLLGH